MARLTEPLVGSGFGFLFVEDESDRLKHFKSWTLDDVGRTPTKIRWVKDKDKATGNLRREHSLLTRDSRGLEGGGAWRLQWRMEKPDMDWTEHHV